MKGKSVFQKLAAAPHILWMIQTTDFVAEGEHIGLFIEPEAIHIMNKSEFSGMFGDYSSFSDELDQLADPTEPEEEEGEE